MSPAMKSFLIVLGLAVAVSVQGQTASPGSTASTTAIPPRFLGILSSPVRAGANVFNGFLNVGQSGVRFGTDAARQITTGVTGAKVSLANTGIGIASSGLSLFTNSIRQFSAMGKAIADAVPIPGIREMGTLGSSLIDMGANMTNLGGQMALSTAQTIVQTKANLTNSAVQMGTGIVDSISDTGFGFAQTGVDMAANATVSLIGAADSMISTGTAMMASGINLVNQAANDAAAAMGNLSLQAEGSIRLQS